jgi:hypothetical protein
MAKMIGDLIREKTGYEETHRARKNDEDRQWKTEAAAELAFNGDPAHERGICHNPKTGGYGCQWCYDDTDIFYAEDLDGIKGVSTNMERLPEL